MIAKTNIDALKALITTLARPLLSKHLTRGVLWVMTAWLGLTAAASQTPAEEIGYALAAIITAAANLWIDRWHHKMDLAEQPPKSVADATPADDGGSA